MSKRLQVVVQADELRRFQRAAQSANLSLSDWVRRALRLAERDTGEGDRVGKLSAVRKASLFAFPAPDVPDMLAEIERGRAMSSPSDPV